MKQEQQQQAQRLYFHTDLSKTQIAETLNISRSSLHSWIRENNWERLKKSAACMPSLIAENCYYIMSHYTEQLLSADHAGKPITREEVDNLHKLSITINKVKNRNTLNESMEMFTGFMESVSEKSPRLLQEIQPLIHEYVAARASITATTFMPSNFNSTGYIPTPPEQDPTEARLDLEENQALAENLKSNTQTQQPQHTHTPIPASTQAGNVTPTPPSPPVVRSLREQLRGTATTGPGKSFYRNRKLATA